MGPVCCCWEFEQVSNYYLLLFKIQLKNGERHLDLGCGWGTFVNYAAEHYGTMSEGVTLAENQVSYCFERLI